MKILTRLTLAAAWLAIPCLAGHDSENWPVRDQETIQKSFTLAGAPMRVVIDNVEGYIHLTGINGQQARMTAHKTIRAETDSDLADARKEVSLDITEKPGSLDLYYAAPWRCNGDDRPCHDGHRRFYRVNYDIDIEVPTNARIVLSTVNNGDIRVENTNGSFEVRDINGGIQMKGIGGSGEVDTINGPVTVRFARNPAEASSFKTLNGQMDVYFQPGLSADLLFKTFNGQVYTDFEVTARASEAGHTEREGGKFVFHNDRFSAARVGQGGPELKFDAFNGNIRLHEAGN
jgi:hypothetical protein